MQARNTSAAMYIGTEILRNWTLFINSGKIGQYSAFAELGKKIIYRYKGIRYKMDAIRQTAGQDSDPIKIDNILSSLTARRRPALKLNDNSDRNPVSSTGLWYPILCPWPSPTCFKCWVFVS